MANRQHLCWIGDIVFRQTIGIPMGTDCAPFLANLFLFSYEFQWMFEKLKKEQFPIKKFKYCCLYTDDSFAINNDKFLPNINTKFIHPS